MLERTPGGASVPEVTINYSKIYWFEDTTGGRLACQLVGIAPALDSYRGKDLVEIAAQYNDVYLASYFKYPNDRLMTYEMRSVSDNAPEKFEAVIKEIDILLNPWRDPLKAMQLIHRSMRFSS